MSDVQIGDTWVSPRGRAYRALRFDKPGQVVLWNETFKQEESAIAGLMVPENGWQLVKRAEADGEAWARYAEVQR